MSKDEVRPDRRYTKDHEWTMAEGEERRVGITAYAVDQLGDITLVNLDVAEGDELEQGKPFGTVESVKTLADLFAPFSGTVVALNGALEDTPELVNDDPYDKGWMIAIRPTAPAQLDALLDAAGYTAFLKSADH